MSETTAVGAVGAAANPYEPAAAPVENPGAILDRDAFLKLLVAQLKYQDPTNPADSSQMLAQSAQLTMVDRLNEMAESFQASASAQRWSLAGTLVGHEITFVDSAGATQTARVETAQVVDDELTLIAGGYSVPYGAIVSVHAPTVGAPVDE